LVDDAISNATMVVIPARPGVFDVKPCRNHFHLPFGAQAVCGGDQRGAALRNDQESPIVTMAREALAKFVRRCGAVR